MVTKALGFIQFFPMVMFMYFFPLLLGIVKQYNYIEHGLL